MDNEEIIDGKPVLYKAFQSEIDRGVMIFKWNLKTNLATLHISQLPKKNYLEERNDYEDAEGRFIDLVNPIIDMGLFEKLRLSRAINTLHELETEGRPIARSHGLDYRTLAGSRAKFVSPTYRDSVIGEDSINESARTIREHGIGHIGNFYWLPSEETIPYTDKEIHVVILGTKGRINFTVPTNTEIIKHVISRVRAFSE